MPTEDSTGFGFIVNGDFSTDPSRRHLILDEYTKSIIDDIAKNYCLLLEKVLQKFTSINKQILSTLIPFSTPELIQFKSSSFTKELIDNGIEQKNINLISLILLAQLSLLLNTHSHNYPVLPDTQNIQV